MARRGSEEERFRESDVEDRRNEDGAVDAEGMFTSSVITSGNSMNMENEAYWAQRDRELLFMTSSLVDWDRRRSIYFIHDLAAKLDECNGEQVVTIGSERSFKERSTRNSEAISSVCRAGRYKIRYDVDKWEMRNEANHMAEKFCLMRYGRVGKKCDSEDGLTNGLKEAVNRETTPDEGPCDVTMDVDLYICDVEEEEAV